MENRILVDGLVALVSVLLAPLARQPLALLTVSGLVSILGSFFHPLAALALMIFSYGFLPDLASLVLVLGYGLLLMAFSFFREEIHLTHDSSYTMVHLWMVLLLVVTLTSSSVQGSLRDLAIHTGGFLLFLGMASLVENKRDVYILLLAPVAGMGILSPHGVSRIFTGAGLSRDWVGVENNPNVRVRIYSLFGNPNAFAEYLVMVLSLIPGLTWSAKKNKAKIFYGGIFLLACISLSFILSQGSLLDSITGPGLFLFLVKKRLFLLGTPGPATLVYLAPQGSINRIQNIHNLQDTSTVYRLTIWKSSLNIIRGRPWSLGLGHLPLRAIYEGYNQIYPIPHAHNTYLGLTVEMNFFDLLVFLVSMTVVFFQAHRYLIKSSDRQVRILGAATLAGLFRIFVHSIFENTFYPTKVILAVWLLIAIIYSLIKVERKGGAYD